MKHRLHCSALLATLVFCFCISCEKYTDTANIVGTWRDTAGDGSGITLYLEQDGSRISGTFKGDNGWSGTIEGVIDGNHMTLTYTYSDGYVVYNEATVDGDLITGTFWSADGTRRGSWTAVRVYAPPSHPGDSDENGDGVGKLSKIVYSGRMNIRIPLPPVPWTYNLDIDGNGSADFVFQSENGPGTFLISQAGNRLLIVDYGGAQVERLNGGVQLGPTAPAGRQWLSGAFHLVSYVEAVGGIPACIGPWCKAQDRFAGISLQINGQTHYGWLRMTMNNSAWSTLHDWAYESRPDTPILAGATK